MQRVFLKLIFTLLLMCTIVLAPNIQLARSESVVYVKVVPETYYGGPPGDEFTIAVMVEGVEDLYGLQIGLSWNATLLDYVSHTVTIPIETHSNGVLYEPTLILQDDVDPVLGTYEIAAACIFGAPSFNGSGTVFEITFLANTTGTCVLDIFISSLGDHIAQVVEHTVIDGMVDISATIPGDVDIDLDVDIFDIVKIINVYGSNEGDPEYILICDLDHDRDIDIYDVIIAADNYGTGIL